MKNRHGGGSRIRTHGAVTLNGFQDRRFRPLSHPSGIIMSKRSIEINYHLGQKRSIFLFLLVDTIRFL